MFAELEVRKSVIIRMNTEAERKKDLPAHTERRVGHEPDANGQNVSGSSSKTSKRMRKVKPRGNHEATEGSSESSDNDESEDSDDSERRRFVIRFTCKRTSR